MRAETQARSWAQRYGGISTVGDITMRSIDRLMINRAEWFGLEMGVVTIETALALIVMSDLTPTVKINLQRFIIDRNEGVTTVSDSTASKYMKILRELRISPSLKRGTDRSIMRLDLKSGTEVKVA
jgi:hypothetical protein